MSYDDDFEDIDQITALAIMDRKANSGYQNQYKPPVKQIQAKQPNKTYKAKPSNSDALKKELAELRGSFSLRNEKIKQLNADKIELQNKIKALESRCDYFENLKIQVRHHVGTDEFLKILEKVNK